MSVIYRQRHDIRTWHLISGLATQPEEGNRSNGICPGPRRSLQHGTLTVAIGCDMTLSKHSVEPRHLDRHTDSQSKLGRRIATVDREFDQANAVDEPQAVASIDQAKTVAVLESVIP